MIFPEVCSAHVVGVSLNCSFNIVGRFSGLEAIVGPQA